MTPPLPLLGREDELARLGECMDALERGGCAIVLLGDPGVGKSALQSQVVTSARCRGMNVLEARGSQSETHLPFASLHQVVRSVLPGVEALSGRQRDALLRAFGMNDIAAAADPFLVSLAVLELVVEAATQRPLLISLDDMHWMDQASLDVLGFVARRLATERIMMVASARPGSATIAADPAITWLSIESLPDRVAERLLDLTSPELSPATRDRIIRQADGNPLALLEFPIAVRSGRAGWSDLTGQLPMTSRLEGAFAGRVRSLPSSASTLLAVAALTDGVDLTEVLRATGLLLGFPVTAGHTQPAVDEGLLVTDGVTFQFRHPLVRSAIRTLMPLSQRLHAHAALAEVITGSPDRATWHRASSVTDPDEEIAARLESAALRAQRRGAVGSAVEWLERAAALTPDHAARGARLLSAAELAFEMGRLGAVEELKTRASLIELRPRDRSRLTWLHGVFDDGTPGEPFEVRHLVSLAREAMADNDSELALQLLVGGARRVWWGDPGADVRHEIVAAAEDVGASPADPRLLACYAMAEPVERGRYVSDQLATWRFDADGSPDVAALLGLTAFCAGDFTRAVGFLSTPVEALRAQGRLALLAQALAVRAWAAIYTGSFELARSAEEAVRLSDETSQPVWGATARIAVATLNGLRGDPDIGVLFAADQVASRGRKPRSSLLAGIQLARGVTDLGAGRFESAYAELRRVFDPSDRSFHRAQRLWALGFLAEAAVHSGQRPEARAIFGDMVALAGENPSPAVTLAFALTAAILADDDSAQAEYESANRSGIGQIPWHRARLELAHGTWLRRRRRVLESRGPLRAARTTFDELGITTWAARANQELRATGETGWQSAKRSWDVLSPQESQIAHLAAQGLSNREISERLYLSHRTVGSHLYRIFPKLDISSRYQLTEALRERDGAASTVSVTTTVP
ncbi:MAG: AAA family ATPase [Nakamurella sp.]